ncbi:histidine kinase [Oleiharenicola lentus]|uniref:histidine kinase n=1 Tax=Oleiharenicola lentus TaxID=2508720 RepID=UPI003F67434E
MSPIFSAAARWVFPGAQFARVTVVILAGLLTQPISLRAISNELGRPIVREFTPGKYRLPYWCPTGVQDAAGYVYVATGVYASVYDGSEMRIIALPTDSAGIRQFALGSDGRVYAAGPGVIGYFRGAGPTAEFVSLANLLPPEARNYDELQAAVAVGDAVYFSDEEKILVWRAGKFTAVPCPTPSRSRGARLHRIGDELYLTIPGQPLSRLREGRIEPVLDHAIFREQTVRLLERDATGAWVMLTAERGTFRAGPDGRVEPLAVEANRWLAGKVVNHALRLGDGSLVVRYAFRSGDGGARFDAAGRYLGPIDHSSGLYMKTLRGFFTDREGGLWIGAEAGLFRVEWPSAVTLFDGVNGLGSRGAAVCVRHGGALHVASDDGVYRLVASDETSGRAAYFERLLDARAYDMRSQADALVVAVEGALFASGANGTLVRVAELAPGRTRLLAVPGDPAAVWVSTSAGIYAVRRQTNGSWRDEGLLSAKQAAQLPQAQAEARLARWLLDTAGVRRAPSGKTDGALLPRLVTSVTGSPLSVFEEIASDGTEIVWVAGLKGLARVETARVFRKPTPFAVQLRATGANPGERLPRRHAAIEFSFEALRHQLENSVVYQTRLAGYESEWSEWSPVRKRGFAALPGGSYRFEVRARDADGNLAQPAVFALTVAEAWWRTGWAWAGYLVVSAAAVAGLVRFRTRALRLRAAQLEAVVAKRTLELAQRTEELALRNAELVRLNQLELDEKISARLAEEKARLEVLRYQLNPHFLFNTLASISAALPLDESPARTMVERLADFCRLTLHRADERDWTTLGEEIELLRAYLEIEESRWGDLLDVEITSDPALEHERLPHFLLLPLVENALKYGRATSPDRVGIKLATHRDTDGALVLEVANTGAWIEPAEEKTVSSLGIGLENLRERLGRHYPRSHWLDIAAADGWVKVTLRVKTPRLL